MYLIAIMLDHAWIKHLAIYLFLTLGENIASQNFPQKKDNHPNINNSLPNTCPLVYIPATFLSFFSNLLSSSNNDICTDYG